MPKPMSKPDLNPTENYNRFFHTTTSLFITVVCAFLNTIFSVRDLQVLKGSFLKLVVIDLYDNVITQTVVLAQSKELWTMPWDKRQESLKPIFLLEVSVTRKSLKN